MSVLLSSIGVRLLLILLLLASNVIASDLLVAAASDLTLLESALTDGFKRASGLGVRFTFGASGMLLREIQNGAPYDVYLSANQMFVEDGIRTGVLTSPETVYADGRIALWSHSAPVERIEQLLQPQFQQISIANPEHAPYGEAARQALEKANLWTKLRWRIVYGENIRQALQFAETGNADAAIVSWTLVYNRGGVLIPDTLHRPIRQTGAVVKITKQRNGAERFLQFLRSAEGQRILRDHGLMPPQTGAP